MCIFISTWRTKHPSVVCFGYCKLHTVVDLVLVMSVNPGFGGQKFIETQIDKIKQIKAMCNAKGVNPWLEVDGGIGPDNAHLVTNAGANAIVAGSAVFKASDYKSVIDTVRESRTTTAAV